MIKATELLMLTPLSIGDVGCAVGYENQMHFSRAFKRVYGVSPREWKNSHKIKKE
jgi:transcriptional regulator GlxA family with amidase domain